MTRRASPRLRAYLLIGAAGLIAGAAFGRPEPVLIAAPMLLAAIAGLLAREDPEVSVGVALASDRVLEGETVAITINLASARPVSWFELALALPPGLAGTGPRVEVVGLDPGADRRLSMPVSATHWGSYRIDRVLIRARDRFGFLAYEAAVEEPLELRVYPRPAAVRRAIGAWETQVFAGDELSSRRGDGIEFADVRPYAPGDQVRRVNWRLSSRRPELFVNELHPERSTDVVILVDTITDVAGEAGRSSLSTALRGANGLADHYLRRRDRVGVISFGGTIRWLVPAMGPAQAYRIADTLLDAQATTSVAWKRVDFIPPRALPPKALVVALTPLVADQVIEGLFDLRGRGFDLAIVELDPERFIPAPATVTTTTARRLWRMRRELLRDRFRRVGVAVATWDPDKQLDPVLEEVRTFRRAAHRASA
jgi:uncharacterized protein (DUF58 family)